MLSSFLQAEKNSLHDWKNCADIEKQNFADIASIEISIKPTHSQRKTIMIAP